MNSKLDLPEDKDTIHFEVKKNPKKRINHKNVLKPKHKVTYIDVDETHNTISCGILIPKLQNRFSLDSVSDVEEETHNNLATQLVSFNYLKNIDMESDIELVFEDDAAGRTIDAINHLPREFSFVIACLDGNILTFSKIHVEKARITKIYYELDYCLSDACRFNILLKCDDVWHENCYVPPQK